MASSYIEELAAFTPGCEQEATDQRAILWYLDQFGDNVLTRDNVIAHITSSGFILNPTLDRALMIHHNIRDAWAWTGGHADSDPDLPAVALREAVEETGASTLRPLSNAIASLDVLVVEGHVKRGRYVSAHLHLSVAYILLCDDADTFRVKPDENTGVQWFDTSAIAAPAFRPHDAYLYGKLIAWARGHAPAL